MSRPLLKCIDCDISFLGNEKGIILLRCPACREFRSKQQSRVNATVNNAIKRGHISREPCEVCGKDKAEAHHENYDEPFNITWLCIVHHREVHNKKYYELIDH